MSDLTERLERALIEARSMIAAATDLSSLDEARVRTLGRKAPLSKARSSLRDVPQTERRDLGRLANEIQAKVEGLLEEKGRQFADTERARRWERERIDVTLPGREILVANLHPLTQTVYKLVDIFSGLGYRVAEGPEIELSRYVFDALNMAQSHPARSPQDTFFVDQGQGKDGRDFDVLLRTETSPVQIRTMESQDPPVYVVVPGRTYRRDPQDATHLSGFTQMEGLAVDENITMGDLKGTLEHAARSMFGRDLDIRLRPHFFPFTEPSAELDVQCFVCRGSGCRMCKHEGWIEVLGCGMVDPSLLEWVGYDAERFTGFAFGMGIERICALSHGIDDIRRLWENDLRFNSQFRGGS